MLTSLVAHAMPHDANDVVVAKIYFKQLEQKDCFLRLRQLLVDGYANGEHLYGPAGEQPSFQFI